jgi:hypothetical protein
MKAYKLTKQMMMDPQALLAKVGACFDYKAFPELVYMNDKDYKQLTKNLRAQYKKDKPYLGARQIDFGVAMTLMNLGPVSMKHGVEPGYVLVDEASLKLKIEEAKLNMVRNTRY